MKWRARFTLHRPAQVIAVLIDNFIKAVSGETQARRPAAARPPSVIIGCDAGLVSLLIANRFVPFFV